MSETEAIKCLKTVYEQFMSHGGQPTMLDYGHLESQVAQILAGVAPRSVFDAQTKFMQDMVERLNREAK